MRVSNWSDFILSPGPADGAAMTVGVFDGIHIGHRELIRRVLRDGAPYESTVITFLQNPKAVLRPETFAGYICSLEQKLDILESLGVAHTVLIDFSRNFSKLSGKEFIDFLKNRGNLRYLVIGSNFRCGHGLETDAARIREMNAPEGIFTDVVSPILQDGIPVSSSRIRAAISAGDLVEAAALLGRNFKLDLSGLSITPGPGGIYFNAAAADRITPPNGRYPVSIHTDNSAEGTVDTAVVQNGQIMVPDIPNARSIEFLISSQGV
ncbi:FAD synthetase family protein [Breznakiella homolactica]|uniref:FAD synthase n=1 Tax=Breznakiella homolactica TaxID=2798577 RepID=A0A7T7XKZ0_9SPIR|nr:FAD synthetase family protein [Breznakiella homolactica]QQO08187.1 FAD synthetase family protein [Breznakiella homolactica]